MTDHKFTDEEVIKALGCCVEGMSEACRKCVFGLNPPYPVCKTMVEKHALDLINRQKAEIADERAKGEMCAEVIARQDKEIGRMTTLAKLGRMRANDYRAMRNKAKTARAEAIKEFAERLCEGRVSNDPVVIAATCMLKEMTGD